MDLDQFAVMFRALYLEGFARPLEGVRVIMRVLLEKYREAGGERRMKCGVRSIVVREGRAAALVLDSGEEIVASHVLSSIGNAETDALIGGARAEAPRLGYVETISVLDRPPSELGWGADTIVFFNDSERFSYRNPPGQVDVRSGIICFPNNFDYGPGPRAPRGPPPRHVPGQLRRLGEPARGRLPRRQAALVRRDPRVGQALPPAARPRGRRSRARRWRRTCSRRRRSSTTPGTCAARSTALR